MAFVPPPYPHDRLGPVRAVAAAVPGGMVDASVGTPVDPMPDVVVRALVDAAPGATGYPATIGSAALREAAAAWIARRFGCVVTTDEVVRVHRHQGAGGVAAACALAARSVTRHRALPGGRVSHLRDGRPARRAAAGAGAGRRRLAPRPRRGSTPPTPTRALVLWLNDPSNPTGVTATPARMRDAVAWARGARHRGGERRVLRRVHLRRRMACPPRRSPPSTPGSDGVLAVHSLSKRSNMAGLRAGFVAGDRALVSYLGEVRKHGGLMTPAPVQAATVAALGDDEHVAEQRDRYARRRAVVLPALEARGLVHDGGSSTFYLWLRDADGPETAGRSPTTSPPPVCWSRRATSTATRAPTTFVSRSPSPTTRWRSSPTGRPPVSTPDRVGATSSLSAWPNRVESSRRRSPHCGRVATTWPR